MISKMNGKTVRYIALSLALTACASPAVQAPQEVPASPVSQDTASAPPATAAAEAPVTPVSEVEPTLVRTDEPLATLVPVLLSPLLSRGCKKGERGVPGPQIGELAIEFTLMDVYGTTYTLSELLREKPVVLIFGSFT